MKSFSLAVRLYKKLPRTIKVIFIGLMRIIPQMLGIMIVTFLMVRAMPGNTALLLLGNTATPETIAALRARLGLDSPIWTQMWIYFKGVLHGDLGVSPFTSNPVTEDLLQRAPATLELISYAMIIMIIIGVGMAIITTVRKNGILDYSSRLYSLLAGAIPDFWTALLLIYFVFYVAGVAPAPFGRIDAHLIPPETITGFLTIDSLLSGNWNAFESSVAKLFLPVLTLVIVYAGMLMKIAKSSFEDIYHSEFMNHKRACGMSEWTIIKSTVRNGMPPVITLVGFLFGFLLGAAVLVETIFSWGGLGQYAVSAVSHSDYPALQGFVLVAGIFIIIVYLIVDVLYAVFDPRIEV